jgi:hypothetical protein
VYDEAAQKAFEKLSEELPDHGQDEIARTLLKVIEQDGRHWDAAFSQSLPKLERLAKKALADFDAADSYASGASRSPITSRASAAIRRTISPAGAMSLTSPQDIPA